MIDDKAQQLAVEAKSIHDTALAVIVRSPREYERAAEDLKRVKGKFKEVESCRVHLKEPVLEQGRRIDEFFRAPLKFLTDAEAAIKKALIGYENEQKRIAAEKQRELEEAARKEREALEAKARAERERIDREAEELRKKALEAQQSGDSAEANKLLVQAATKVADSEEKAESILAEAATKIAPTVSADIPLVAGQSTKTVWRARVVDASKVPDQFKIVDDKLIQDYAKATKGKVPVAGLEFYPEEIKSSRAA